MKGFGQIFLLLAASSLSGCLNSPILNHTEEQPSTPKSTESLGASQQQPCLYELKQTHLCVDITWKQQQTSDEMGTGQMGSFDLFFWDPATGNRTTGPFLDPGAIVTVKLWMKMTGMSHGSSPTTVTPTNQAGIFSVTDVYFSMSGKWEIQINLLNDSQKLIEKTIIPFQQPQT